MCSLHYNQEDFNLFFHDILHMLCHLESSLKVNYGDNQVFDSICNYKLFHI